MSWRRDTCRRPEGCTVCSAGRPFGVTGELARTWITTDPEVAFYGYVCVISKIHAVEPFELTGADRAAFFDEAMLAAERVNELVRPSR